MKNNSFNEAFAWLFLVGSIIAITLFSVLANAENQTGTCTAGTQYCENNGLTTINNTVTTNTNTNTKTTTPKRQNTRNERLRTL